MIAIFLLFGGAVIGWIIHDKHTKWYIRYHGFEAYREKYMTDYL